VWAITESLHSQCCAIFTKRIGYTNGNTQLLKVIEDEKLAPHIGVAAGAVALPGSSQER
jgi:hypothetical protein